jgi:HAE1 family hydrophobic/amphiphilic exporter-1
MLVDNAVVVLESIYQKLEKGMDRVTAARVGTQEVITAVMAATLTSIIIFVPLIFGEKTNFSVFFGNAGASIVFALLASLFASLTLIPLAMALLLNVDVKKRSKWQRWMVDRLGPVFLRLGRGVAGWRGRNVQEDGTAREQGPRLTWTDRYIHMVMWPLQHRMLVGLLIVPLVIGGSIWVLMNKVPDNTPEAQSQRDLSISYEFSENFHYVKIVEDYIRPVEAFLLANKEAFKITDVFSNYNNSSAGTRIYFDNDSITIAEMGEIREKIKEGLPVIPGAKIAPGQGGAQNREWISASLYGDDPRTLAELSAEAKRRLLANPGFSDVYTALDQGREEVQIKLDRELTRKYGISADMVSQFLGIVVRASQLGSYGTPHGEVEIWVQLRQEDLQDLNDLKALVVGGGPTGEAILLSQVADFRIEPTPARLQRENRRTYTEIYAVYTGEKKEEGRAAVSKVMDSLAFPRDYGWSYGFWTQQEQKDDKTFLFNLLLALFMVYFVMASLFESLAHPFAIILSLPFAAVGVAWFLLLTGTPFNMMAMIGMLVLIGVVVNNGIVLIDHINNLRRKGLPRFEAITAGCRERLRPILMTASTTVVGLVPLAWGDSGLFEMRYFPMARTVMGGLIASTALTLVVLPTYYTLFDDLAAWIKRTWYQSNPSREQEPLDAPASGD